MPRIIPSLLPKLSRLLAQVGANLKQARLRRSYSAEIVAERSGITRRTLQRVEQGDPAVALGIYARGLQALVLVEGGGAPARDDAVGRRLEDLDLPIRKRAPRQSNADEKARQKR